MPTAAEIKQNVDTFIIDPDSPQSVTRANVGGIIKSTVDYTDQEVEAQGLALMQYTDDAIATAIAGVYQIAGTYDASVGTFPTTGTGESNSVQAGDVYRVTVAGTLGGVAYSVNDTFYALIDNPGQTSANWARFNTNSGEATTDTLGTVRRATDSELNEGGTGVPNASQVKNLIGSTPADLGYKEYKAYFTQTGTSNPTVTVVSNTLGGTVNWIRETTGYYSGTLTNAFTTNKTFISNNRFTYEDQAGAASPKNVRIVRNSLNVVSVQTFAGTTPADVGISGMSIEIYVYN